MDIEELSLQVLSKSNTRDLLSVLHANVSNNAFDFILGQISLTNFKSDGGSSQLPLHAFVLKGFVVVQVDSHADTAFSEGGTDLVTLSV